MHLLRTTLLLAAAASLAMASGTDKPAKKRKWLNSLVPSIFRGHDSSVSAPATFTPDTMNAIIKAAKRATGPKPLTIPTPGFTCGPSTYNSKHLECTFQTKPSYDQIKSAVKTLEKQFAVDVDRAKYGGDGWAFVYMSDFKKEGWAPESAFEGTKPFTYVYFNFVPAKYYDQVYFVYGKVY